MADEDKEKAEKLAAAKKRFEQLKKEQQKKGKKGGAKKKKEGQEKKEKEDKDNDKQDDTEKDADELTTDNEPTTEQNDKADQESDGEPGAEPERTPSLSAASKQRSESFRAGTAHGTTSPGSTNPQGEVQELYRKQAARIEELEQELKAAKLQNETDAARLTRSEEEVDRLREDSGNLAELKSKASQSDQLRDELASIQRQLAQAQQAAKGDKRRASGASSDLAQQLDSKTSTIESLELDLSNLQQQVKTLQTSISEKEASFEELEQRAKAAEEARAAYEKELDALKVSIAFPSDEGKDGAENPEALKKRVTILESDLRTANSNLEAASQRATSLDQKLGAVTKLHKDASTASQSKDKEISDLRNQLKKRDRPSHVRDASEFELGEEETETGALQAKIRALEAENFELRRGIWRDKRTELQPGIEDGAAPGDYEDVDLNGPYSPLGRKPSGTAGQQSSSFQDVIASGISAFTGRPREPPRRPTDGAAHGRKASLGLLDDDEGFDEEAFRLAQEEEARKRIERVKEVKRGLGNWKGWRVDLAELRQQGVAMGKDCGPVFEI